MGHDRDKPIGRIEFIERTEDDVQFEALITDDAAWQMVKDGVLTGVSVGFIAHDWHEEEGTTFITDWELVEINLVTTPANAEALIMEMRSMLEHEVFTATRAAPTDPPLTRTPPPAPRTVASRTVVPNTQPAGEVDLLALPDRLTATFRCAQRCRHCTSAAAGRTSRSRR